MFNRRSKWLKKLELNYNRLSNLKKLAIFTAIVIIIFFVWSLQFFSFLKTYQQTANERNQKKSEVHYLQKQVDSLTSDKKTQNSPALLAQEKIKIDQLAAINQKIDAYQQKLISPDKLLLSVKELLNENYGLRPVSFNNLPRVDLNVIDNNPPTNKKNDLYIYPVEMHIRGNYLQLLNFFYQTEKYHNYIFWDELNYKTGIYPNADINLKFHMYTSQVETNEKKP